ncbi:MAG: GYDIA family GHMP kinase [Cellulophaga sp.]
MTKEFYSNGKLLLTGEYAVLDGALSLAVPTTYGQSLTVKSNSSTELLWKSIDEAGICWFECKLKLEGIQKGIQKQSIIVTKNTEIAEMLFKILFEATKLNVEFLNSNSGCEVTTKLTFPREWGLGTSSTLINNVASWAQVDAYVLLNKTFGGSGYDIACAQHNTPIHYTLKQGISTTKEVSFTPTFKEELFFVYLNKKQNSRDGIAQYRKSDFDTAYLIEKISRITLKMTSCTNLEDFETLIEEHENLIANTLQIPLVKPTLFPTYKGVLKSLGAWGGDFVLATRQDALEYFPKMGYKTVIPYSKMVL